MSYGSSASCKEFRESKCWDYIFGVVLFVTVLYALILCTMSPFYCGIVHDPVPSSLRPVARIENDEYYVSTKYCPDNITYCIRQECVIANITDGEYGVYNTFVNCTLLDDVIVDDLIRVWYTNDMVANKTVGPCILDYKSQSCYGTRCLTLFGVLFGLIILTMIVAVCFT